MELWPCLPRNMQRRMWRRRWWFVVEGKTETVIGEKPPAPVSATKGLADPAIAIAAISGVCISFQTGMNGAMGKTSYGPSFATLYSLITANVAMILFMLFDAYVLRHPIDVSKYKQVPWFGWLSGCLGFTYVMCVTFLTLRLGAANLLGVNVAMQVVSAMVFDHFGWMGFTVRKLTFVRGAGAVLVVGGVIMITLLR
ncbi:hypothetical protein BC829DRAFT_281713 [Chytridium lagenaria]|nr:hypothetical protein BC829DRAFT_281713 [Chytridium lagenaria]